MKPVRGSGQNTRERGKRRDKGNRRRKMYEIQQAVLGSYRIYELRDTASGSWVKVAPERGGIIISLGLAGEELLFLNEATFMDGQTNIRGGIPILFPICGQLDNGEYELNGHRYMMKNHGVARNLPWQIESTDTESELSISLTLGSTEETKQAYPFDFQLRFKYVLEGNKLTIHQEYINKSAEKMPMYAGFHPYFKTSHKKLELVSDARFYLDANDDQTKPFEGYLDLEGRKEALFLLDAKESSVSFNLQELNRTVTIAYDAAFKYTVYWTEEGQDFVCVEPWMAKTNEFNNKQELVWVEPGQSLHAAMSIKISG
jgi:galactose mutarotase-like enzyme